MGRSSTPAHTADSSPDIEIKVQPRHSNLNSPFGIPPPPAARTAAARRPPPPPHHPAYKPFKSWFPWLVPTIVVANIVLFIISMYINNCPSTTARCIAEKSLGRFSFQPTHENPLLGPSAKTLLAMGALEAKKVVEDSEAWRLASCMWLHAGVFHILANMLSLLFVGIRLEQEFGFLRIGLLYVISGIGGSLLSSLFVRTTISVGASGALFGLLGGMLSELFTNWTIYANKGTALLTLVLIILVNLAVGVLPHVDNYAHLGGFGTGFFLGFVLLIRPQFGWVNQKTAPPGYYAPPARSKYKIYQWVLLVISVIVLLGGFITGFTLLLKGVDGNSYCSWCHYLSCVPTPLWSCEARCRSMQRGDNLNLTCLHNGKTKAFSLSSNITINLEQMCLQLCS